MTPPADPQIRTIETFIACWKKQDVAGILSLWSADFTQAISPSTLGIPEKSRAEAEYVFAKLTSVLHDWKLEIRDIVNDIEGRKVVIYSSSVASTPVPDAHWIMEYVTKLSFTEDGTKIKRLEETLDTAKFMDVFPKIAPLILANQSPIPLSY
ncbi:hypothetical protein LTR66_005133 [Elasticomyces elasticus]|nr:hypothetical protein LTR66_005133 [Elasticomyces elasticus]